MEFVSTPIDGCLLIHPTIHADERGHFARTWDPESLGEHGVNSNVAQCSVSFNESAGTLRGMHLQRQPHAESKIVRCTRGAIFDVCLDLREDSATFRTWIGATLSEDNGVSLVIPEGCAHGFLTLTDASEVFYMISAAYAPDAAGGVHHADPAFGIEWPRDVNVINKRDATYPFLNPS